MINIYSRTLFLKSQLPKDNMKLLTLNGLMM